MFIQLASGYLMNKGKKYFLLVFDTFFSTALFDPFTQKVGKGRRSSQPPTEATVAPKKQRWGADRPLKTTAALHTGRSVSRLSPMASGQGQVGDTQRARIPLCSVLPAGPWSSMASHTPSFFLFLSLSQPFLVKGLPGQQYQISAVCVLGNYKILSPFSF